MTLNSESFQSHLSSLTESNAPSYHVGCNYWPIGNHTCANLGYLWIKQKLKASVIVTVSNMLTIVSILSLRSFTFYSC